MKRMTTHIEAICFTFALVLLLGGSNCRASSAMIVDLFNQKIHVAGDQDEIQDAASLLPLAVVMAGLDLVSEKGIASMADKVTIGTMAAGEGSSAGLLEGDVVSLRDLLLAALLTGDRCATSSIAVYLGSLGSKVRVSESDALFQFESELDALTDRVKAEHTVLKLRKGTKRQQAQTTAKDVTRLMVHALSSPAFRFIAQQHQASIQVKRANRTPTLTLRNPAMNSSSPAKITLANDRFVVATESAPSNFVAQSDGSSVIYQKRIIVVLLGSASPMDEAEQLMKQGWTAFERWLQAGRPVTNKNQLLYPPR